MESTGPVLAHEETVVIPTYPAPPPDPNPMFFEKRVNQGASGRVYPNPFTDHVNHEKKVDQPYRVVFLENEYLQLIVLPQFGGRIHAALDKTNGYDFIYRQHVIKPALIGLFGSWLSGGMEFNWPLHHRPSTFMLVEYTIERGSDGSATLWLSEHEPMNRMKGMVGICLYPDKAYFELKVQLYNRTPLPQPFLWWVNCAVSVNDQYQLIFPPDVESVTYHSRAFMASYPLARQIYAGLDWRSGVDISWLKNVNGSSSFFANSSMYNFFGGYDHGKQAGIIHVANHHTSPGKKLFTWGVGEFGTIWQSSLTDSGGPYAELMASSYSDNQPDFSWLQPYEMKVFRQYWYPIQHIGAVKNANVRLAVSLEDKKVGICATEVMRGARIQVMSGDTLILETTIDLCPGKPFLADFNGPVPTSIKVLDVAGNEIISYQPEPVKNEPLPDVAVPTKQAEKINSLEELYLTGLHVEQYLHFALDPAPYWERAIALDPIDSRSNNALGRLLIRRGDYRRAEMLLRQSIKTLTRYNFNPYDGEPYYNLGLTLAWQGRYDEAYEAFYKSIWSYAWQSAGYYALAQIDCRRGDFGQALDHIGRSLATNSYHSQARALQAAALRHLGRPDEALKVARAALDFDPLHHWAQNEVALALQDLGFSMEEALTSLERSLRGAEQNYLDLAFDYADAGLYEEAIHVLECIVDPGVPAYSTYPMVYYARGYFSDQMEQTDRAAAWYRQAALQPIDLCFPARPEEMIVLQAARQANPMDGRAAYYLGNLLYDKKQYEPAIQAWQDAVRLEPSLAVAWRNLGIAYYNKRGDKQSARDCYEKAFTANPSDPRYLLETTQLMQRMSASQIDRLALLEAHPDLVEQREDLLVNLAELYNQTGRPEKALEVLLGHTFHPWEGGEGSTSCEYVLAHVLLGQAALKEGWAHEALAHFEQALDYPPNLGEGKGTDSLEALVHYHAGLAWETLGDMQAAQAEFQKVLDAETSWTVWMPFSPLTYYVALAMQKRGDKAGSTQKLQAMLEFAGQQLAKGEDAAFYTSRPTMVVFDDDPQEQNSIFYHNLMGLAHKGLGQKGEAHREFEAVLALNLHHWEAEMELQEMKLNDPESY